MQKIQIYSICNIVLKFHKLLLQYSYKTYKTKECSLEDELTEGKIELLLRKKKQEKEFIGFWNYITAVTRISEQAWWRTGSPKTNDAPGSSWILSHFLSRLSEIIEGDILMTDNLRRTLNAADKSRNKRDIVTDMVMRWPDGVVPYVLDASLSKYSCKLY